MAARRRQSRATSTYRKPTRLRFAPSSMASGVSRPGHYCLARAHLRCKIDQGAGHRADPRRRSRGGPARRERALDHSVRDPRMHATLARLEALFDVSYPINHQRPAGAVRPWAVMPATCTTPAARISFRRWARRSSAFSPRRQAENAQVTASWFERGDAYLATVRAYTGPEGDLSEQFDQDHRCADFRPPSRVELRGVHHDTGCAPRGSGRLKR